MFTRRLLDVGHEYGKVLYRVFNRSAKDDAKRRLPSGIVARTVHSSAWNAIENSNFSKDTENSVFADDGRIEEAIKDICRHRIDEMVGRVKNAKDKIWSKE